MPSSSKYYTLVTRDAEGVWSPQFGDYDRTVVKEELDYYKSSYGYKRDDIKILQTNTAYQKDISAAIESLNHHLKAQYHGFVPSHSGG